MPRFLNVKLPVRISRCEGCGVWVLFRTRCGECERVEAERLAQLASIMARAELLRGCSNAERDRLERAQIGVWFQRFSDIPGQEHHCDMLQPGNWMADLREVVQRLAPGEVA